MAVEQKRSNEASVYNVMLEGRDPLPYFITYSVVANSEDEAITLSMKKAQELGQQIISIEEVEKTENLNQDKYGIIRMSGKSYFDE